MKKKNALVSVIICFVFFLGGCNFSHNDRYLEYPGLEWGMLPEEVLDQLNIREENVSLHDTAPRTESYVFNDIDMFGEEASQVICNFLDTTYTEDYPDGGEEGADCGLAEIRVFYSDDADMEKVFTEMNRVFGDTNPEIYEYGPGIITPDQVSLNEKPTRESESLKLWGGPQLSDFIPESQSLQYRDIWKQYKRGLNDQNWEQFRENGRLVTAYWTNGGEEAAKGICLDAMNLVVYNELKTQIEN